MKKKMLIIMSLMLAALTIYAVIFTWIQISNLNDFIANKQNWYKVNTSSTGNDYLAELAYYRGWRYKGELCLYLIGLVDLILLFFIYQSRKNNIRDWFRNNRSKSYSEMSTEQQKRITEKVYCKNCKSYEEMYWLSDTKHYGLNMYELSCKKCNTEVRIRKDK